MAAGRKYGWFVVLEDVEVLVKLVDISGPTAADTELDSELVDFARIFCILLLN